MADYDLLRDRLDALAEDLADAAIDALRAAIRAGETGRPKQERTLTQARRAVEKASGLLRNLTDGTLGE